MSYRWLLSFTRNRIVFELPETSSRSTFHVFQFFAGCFWPSTGLFSGAESGYNMVEPDQGAFVSEVTVWKIYAVTGVHVGCF